MITVTKQTEEEQREMYSKMPKIDIIDMLIESNKYLNRILENTSPIYDAIPSACNFFVSRNDSSMNCNNCGKPHDMHYI